MGAPIKTNRRGNRGKKGRGNGPLQKTQKPGSNGKFAGEKNRTRVTHRDFWGLDTTVAVPKGVCPSRATNQERGTKVKGKALLSTHRRSKGERRRGQFCIPPRTKGNQEPYHRGGVKKKATKH